MKGKVFIFLSIILLALAIALPHLPGETESAARKVEKTVSERFSILEKYAERMLDESPYCWTEIEAVDEDMVIYRYLDDSIQCWVNQFPVLNDDISSMTFSQRLTNPRASVTSPLAGVTDTIGFYNFGPGWYLARSRSEGNVKVIYGLSLVNTTDTRTFNGINPVFRLGDNYSFKPVASSEGSIVNVEGKPMFKVQYESLSGSTASNGLFIWLAFAFYVLGSILLLIGRPTVKQMCLLSSGILLAVFAMFVWGRGAQDPYVIFSPSVYADGAVFYSLGAIILINLAICLLSANLFIVRKSLFDRVRSRNAAAVSAAAVTVSLVLILAYTHFSLKSIIQNSNISLELFKLDTLSRFTFIVLASYLGMLLSVPMLLELLRPSLRLYRGLRFDPLSAKSRIVLSIVTAIYLVVISSVFGFRKEQDRIEVMANRLAVDRDISLELQLRRAEKQIATDPIIASLTLIENGESSILHRLTDIHLSRLSQNYYISVKVGPGALPAPDEGQPISEGSSFGFFPGPMGFPEYDGVFFYNIPGYGVSNIVITVEPRIDRKEGGYASLMGFTPPGSVQVPSRYSYAHYDGRRLLHYKGSYAYSTTMDDKLNRSVYEERSDHFVSGDYVHFNNPVADRETIILSRERISPIYYLMSAVALGLLMFLILSLLSLARRHRVENFSRNYYRTRINWVVMLSLILTLFVMAAFSVIFVYRRNESNMYGMMSEKINSIQTMLKTGARGVRSTEGLRDPSLHLLDNVSNLYNTDVSLFSPDGHILLSTAPRVYENLMLGSRINGEAYDNIVCGGHRYYIQKESLNGYKYYSMYAPLIAENGNVLAVINAPFTDESLGFERDAVSYSLMIVTVFLLLLLIARFITSSMVDRMFKPLSEMGRKMSNAGLDSLEKVRYDRNDEIFSLVQAYNRMVDELSESSKQLAQAERDKAWSGMARQVAHEIKNPLTPMKLQLQRIIRLKEKNDPNWQDKFDEMSKVLLDHIDILTDTANEFSTFAKLYTEEPSVISLDDVLQEEISMFDSKSGINFEYFGLEGASVSGPKPQLTRVFVNLINNSVQALEGRDDGRIRVALRKSTIDGFYDIVFEDNGPGVPEENVSKLFTPNFTTKNGGSGLGLAISRSILERCGASIAYSKSFALGGACFTISYPCI